jgi:hypothetical protein
MDILNHVKIVTPDPQAVDSFLREVLDLPKGWPLGALPDTPRSVSPTVATDDGQISWKSVIDYRASDRKGGGFITGSRKSGQLQILAGDRAHIWGVAIGTRDLEGAHRRCQDRGIPCSEMELVPWGDDGGGIRAFFAEVGGIVFEVMRVEPGP